ncbi:MAG: LCP family protein, partial [Anaerotignum sp.]|nr:LCP family protein [Anaerotignum sp.]
GAANGVFAYMVGGLNRSDINEENLSANEGLEGVINIALYGVDSRNNDYVGRSDAILICSVNGETGKIKLVSVARDTYVSVPGHYHTKINHAYAYGGPELAIQTLNENFGLDVTDYVTVNFQSLADIIDEMGGVMIDVTEEERFQVNAYLERGLPLSETGMVNLTGAQAVSYSRIRKIDSDSMRASRQREVLAALFDKALEINPLNYPSYVRKFSPMVETSLSNDEILKIATVGLKKPILEQAAFPNNYIPSGGEIINGAWYYVYDLEQAKDMLHQYIYEDIPFEHYGLTEEEIAVLEEEESAAAAEEA